LALSPPARSGGGLTPSTQRIRFAAYGQTKGRANFLWEFYIGFRYAKAKPLLSLREGSLPLPLRGSGQRPFAKRKIRQQQSGGVKGVEEGRTATLTEKRVGNN